MMQELDTRNDVATEKRAEADKKPKSAFTQAQFYQRQSWSTWYHTRLCLKRQLMFMTRSPEFVIPRIGQAIFLGLVMGSLFWQLGSSDADYPSRYGLILFALINIAFANMAEVPLAVSIHQRRTACARALCTCGMHCCSIGSASSVLDDVF